jgi:hypothetical protein
LGRETPSISGFSPPGRGWGWAACFEKSITFPSFDTIYFDKIELKLLLSIRNMLPGDIEVGDGI